MVTGRVPSTLVSASLIAHIFSKKSAMYRLQYIDFKGFDLFNNATPPDVTSLFLYMSDKIASWTA
jgi:hypothetical protein